MSVTRVNQFRAQPGREAELRERLENIVAGLRATEGCEACSLLQDVEESGRFVVLEEWQSREAHQAAVQGIETGDLQAFIALLAEAPTGGYVEAGPPKAGDENA
jgi:quinol monooxygenase YgiN